MEITVNTVTRPQPQAYQAASLFRMQAPLSLRSVTGVYSPHVVPLAVCLLLFDEAGAIFVKELLTLSTLEA